jgi:multidrug resistance efflux pump
MTQAERRLLRHLVTAVLIKLVVLVLLWWAFVRDARVSVDTDRVAAQLGGQAISQGASK